MWVIAENGEQAIDCTGYRVKKQCKIKPIEGVLTTDWTGKFELVGYDTVSEIVIKTCDTVKEAKQHLLEMFQHTVNLVYDYRGPLK